MKKIKTKEWEKAYIIDWEDNTVIEVERNTTTGVLKREEEPEFFHALSYKEAKEAGKRLLIGRIERAEDTIATLCEHTKAIEEELKKKSTKKWWQIWK